MDQDALQLHIASCAARTFAETGTLIERLHDGDAPARADRTDPAALGWVRHWHAGRCEAPLPACTCATGRCRFCN